MSLTAESVKLFLGYEESENDPAVLQNIEMLIAPICFFTESTWGVNIVKETKDHHSAPRSSHKCV